MKDNEEMYNVNERTKDPKKAKSGKKVLIPLVFSDEKMDKFEDGANDSFYDCFFAWESNWKKTANGDIPDPKKVPTNYT